MMLPPDAAIADSAFSPPPCFYARAALRYCRLFPPCRFFADADADTLSFFDIFTADFVVRLALRLLRRFLRLR